MGAKFLQIVFVAFLVAACGGGGGGAGGSGPASASNSAASTSSGSGTSQPSTEAAMDLVRGVVTGFGSVFIDGTRFDTSNAVFSKDDEVATQDDLRVGMVVELRGNVAAGTAENVDFEEDVKGPIDAISPSSDELTVLGQTILITPNTRFDEGVALSNLGVGEVLEISGLRGVNDVLEASFIEKKTIDEVNAYKVIGQVRDLDSTAQTFRIGGLQIDYNAARLDDGLVLANGQTVEVKDENKAYSPGDLNLIVTRIEPAGLGQGAVDTGNGGGNNSDNLLNISSVQVEGLINVVRSANQFELAGTIVNHGANTQFIFGDANLLTVGTKVQVEGVLEEDASISAAKIKFARNSARLHGRVELVDFTAESLSILGVTVDLSQVQELEDKRDDLEPFTTSDIMTGDFLEIRGNSAGAILIANEVERDDSDDTRVRGPADNVDVQGRTLTILGVSIVTSSNTQYRGVNDEVMTADVFFAALANGQTLVDAQWNGSVTDATVAVRELALEN